MPVDNTIELDQNHPQWPECKEKMRPMKKALKALDNPNKGMTQEEQIQHTKKCLIQIGDHIEKTLQQYQDHDSHKEWKNLLWQFVSKFTEYDAKKLHKLYKKHKKLVDEKSESAQKEDKKEHRKDNDHKEKKKGKDDKKEKSNKHTSHKRRHEEEQNTQQNTKKKPYNGWSTDRNRDGGKRSEKNRERDQRDRDRSRDRDRNSDKNYQRSWRNSSSGREYGKESRYPQDFKREGGYHREGFKSHGYHRGPSDWGGRPHHQKHPNYGIPSVYPHPGHYPPPMYGILPAPGNQRIPPHSAVPYGGVHWSGKGRNERHDWGKDIGGGGVVTGERIVSNPDWAKKDPRQERKQQQF